MPVTGGPYLCAALMCEKVLREGDGVLSFIRIVDKWTVTGAAEVMPPTVIQTNLVLLFKSGIHRGGAQIRVTPTSPTGRVLESMIFPTIFEGDDDRGTAVVAVMGFPASEDGLYWFEVALNEQVVTRVPLRVQYLRVQPQLTPTAAG